MEFSRGLGESNDNEPPSRKFRHVSTAELFVILYKYRIYTRCALVDTGCLNFSPSVNTSAMDPRAVSCPHLKLTADFTGVFLGAFVGSILWGVSSMQTEVARYL